MNSQMLVRYVSTPHFTGEGVEIIQQNGNKITVTFKPRSLNIVWGGDKRYWCLPENVDGFAELIQVCWLEITASIDISKLQAGRYKVGFLISMKPNAFGWNEYPIKLMGKIGKKGNYKTEVINLSTSDIGTNSEKLILLDDPFDITNSPLNDTLYFGLYEIWSGRWKGGLLIHEAKIISLP